MTSFAAISQLFVQTVSLLYNKKNVTAALACRYEFYFRLLKTMFYFVSSKPKWLKPKC